MSIVVSPRLTLHAPPPEPPRTKHVAVARLKLLARFQDVSVAALLARLVDREMRRVLAPGKGGGP